MIVAIDVYYRHRSAVAAAVLFAQWTSEGETAHFCEPVERVEPYRPGSFFQRELPCVLKVLRRITTPLSTIVVDGYVWLGSDERPGLGGHLYTALDKTIPVIGVAKSYFRQSSNAVPVLRGKSRKPLHVTAAGMDPVRAATCIAGMHGPHRIPTLLKRVDALSRGLE
jgi:deoxyribonuclease V